MKSFLKTIMEMIEGVLALPLLFLYGAAWIIFGVLWLVWVPFGICWHALKGDLRLEDFWPPPGRFWG